jgi:aryl-alcohol dehydrogenase-like predicted oxidoreductase
MNFGWHTDEQGSRTIMEAALDAGVNFFETADVYGAGASESILGRWFADDPSRRDKVVLANQAVHSARRPAQRRRPVRAVYP